MNSKKLDPILVQALANQEAYDAGIVPFNGSALHHDMNRVLSTLPPEEARKLRRKFRKMWRKLIRKNTQATSTDLIKRSDEGHRTGLGQPNPKEHHRTARKVLVYWELNKRARAKAAG
jgi:hypothetical protein